MFTKSYENSRIPIREGGTKEEVCIYCTWIKLPNRPKYF